MHKNNIEVIMLAAECKGIARSGGVGDVLYDLSALIAELGNNVSLILPYYDVTWLPDTVDSLLALPISFGGKSWDVSVFVFSLNQNLTVYLLRNEQFFGGDCYGDIYVDSSKFGYGFFEDDAKRFAFFSVAALEFINQFDELNKAEILHCHDWHTGVFLFLLNYVPQYQSLKAKFKTIFTIHNLTYQGTRPVELPLKSKHGRKFVTFADWFPRLFANLKTTKILESFTDPRSDMLTFNPMRAGILLADRVNTVSPTYAKEIAEAKDQGLGDDLHQLAEQGRLTGILNGIDYEEYQPANFEPPFDLSLKNWAEARKEHKKRLINNLRLILTEVLGREGNRFWNRSSVFQKLASIDTKKWLTRPLLVSISRAARQKMQILTETLEPSDHIVLQEILDRDISLIVLGTGEMQDELEIINDYDNGLFLSVFDSEFADMLYVASDLFLMPSDFEPCGISQMIAMRYGSLPIVHDIGGLHDTVENMVTGFSYKGEDRITTRHTLIASLESALEIYHNNPQKWRQMQENAMKARFDWATSAKEYIMLYES